LRSLDKVLKSIDREEIRELVRCHFQAREIPLKPFELDRQHEIYFVDEQGSSSISTKHIVERTQ